MEDSIQKSGKGKNIGKLTLSNGLQTGIINLDAILREVHDLNLTSHEEIQAELLEKVKVSNFVPSGVEKEYAFALLEEYLNRYDSSEESKRKIHKKPHAG